MTPDVASLGEEAPLEEVVSLMEKKRIRRVPVVTDGRLVGIVSRAVLLKALYKMLDQSAPAPTGDAALRAAVIEELRRQNLGRPRAGVGRRYGRHRLSGRPHLRLSGTERDACRRRKRERGEGSPGSHRLPRRKRRAVVQACDIGGLPPLAGFARRFDGMNGSLIGEIISSTTLFRGVPGAVLEKAHDAARALVAPAKTVLFHQGDAPAHLILVGKGFVKMGQVSGRGEASIVRIMEPGDVPIGCVAVFRRNPYPATATTLIDSVMLSWPAP